MASDSEPVDESGVNDGEAGYFRTNSDNDDDDD